MKKDKVKIFSVFSIISIIIFAFAFILYVFSISSYGFADFVNEGISHYLRSTLALINGVFDFSIFEFLIIFSPFILGVIVYIAFRSFKRRDTAWRFVVNLASVLLLVLSVHILALGVGYKTTPVATRMDLNESDISHEELCEVAAFLSDEINLLAPQVKRDENGVFESGYSYAELSSVIAKSYSDLTETYDLPPAHNGRAKGVILGGAMSRLGITGIYTSITGEANVNTAYPDYVTIFTTAHEMCHQRGILRENEANFVAYLITSTSDDINLRYSAALNMFSYISSAIYKTDKEGYYALWSNICQEAKVDYVAANEVSDKYGDTIIEKISDWINDLYLESNGTEGIVSYSKVVELMVAYYNKNK